MTTNLEIVLDYMGRIAAGEFDGALSMASDDASFQLPDGVVLDKAGMRGMFASVSGLLVNPLDQTIVGTTSEGERVAVESTASTLLANGNTYSNIYHFLYVVRNGQIVIAKEYCNTRAIDAFG